MPPVGENEKGKKKKAKFNLFKSNEKKHSAPQRQELTLDLQDTITPANSHSLAGSLPFPTRDSDTSYVKIQLILWQPHSSIMIQKEVKIKYPVRSKAFEHITKHANWILVACTMRRPSSEKQVGHSKPVELSALIAGVSIKVCNQTDLEEVIAFFSECRQMPGSSGEELRLRILCPTDLYEITVPRGQEDSLEILDAPSISGIGGAEYRQFAAISPPTPPPKQTSSSVSQESVPQPIYQPSEPWSKGRSRYTGGSLVSASPTSCCSRAPSIASSFSSINEQFSIKDYDTFRKRFHFLNPPIGRGAFGIVYRCLDNFKVREYAVKVVKVSDSSCLSRYADALAEELRIMAKVINNHHVVKYYGSFSSGMYFYIVMEYMSSGSVRALIDQFGGALNENMTRLIARQAAAGLAFLHKRQIAHLDFRCSNLLRSPSGTIKVADFGCSKMITDLATNGGNRPVESSHERVVMTPVYWLSPEVILNRTQLVSVRILPENNFETLSAVDIWSFGCVIVEMATQYPPFYDPKHPNKTELEVMHEVISMRELKLDLPAGCSESLKSLLRRLFAVDPMSRPSAEQIRTAKFLKTSEQQLFDEESD